MSSIEPTVALKVAREEGSVRRRALGFGATIAAVLGAAAAWKLHRGSQDVGLGLLGVAALVLGYAIVHPRGALVLRSAWLRFGAFLGKINSAIILSALYFLVVTPIGLVMRVFGRRSFRADRRGPYSVPRKDREPTHFEHPY